MRHLLFCSLLFICLASCKKSSTTDEPTVDIGNGTWRISYFLDQQDKTATYSSYYFMFLEGGTFMAHGTSNVITGTWSQTSTRININFTNPAMSELNGNWLKTEFTGSSIKLKNDNPSQDDQLYFTKN